MEQTNFDDNVAHPFLKWAGGKSQLLEKFRDIYPPQLTDNKIENYYEPFLGSGAVFFEVAQKYKIENAFLYDINDDLILTYKVVQKDVDALLHLLNRYQKKFDGLNSEKRKTYFYDERTKFNLHRNEIDYNSYSDKWFARAAQFIFLNKTCYNGLYRVNSKGEFNCPAGEYANPKICHEKNFIAVNRVLQMAEIKKADFSNLLHNVKPKSFVYFDPPYRPISKTSSFKAYAKNDFGDHAQRLLASLFAKLDKKGAKVMLSNSDPKNIDAKDNFFDELYSGFNIERIPARRIINSNATRRGVINEIIVTNYETKVKRLK